MPRFHLADFLPYQLSVASNAVSRAVATGTGYEARFGLTAAEWRVLAAVTAAGNPAQAELLAATGMDKMTISRAVAGLTSRRLLDRARDTADRRTLRLSPTAEGRRIHAIVAPQALEVEARLLAALSADEAAVLRAALAKLRSACDGP
ncbi:MarR family winged helix-turn-helix transcriptional regulator [Polymorphobacter fuscus]|uniref:MarR family transcriptional regulator n=1 Tax=Sandarakinorhabdus fusca TaxID=1439888 RepID=A0A7C9GNC2_9SPHN|nr:MarR family winged helix-turn-helix transcriptional regulator [Polymorphobacter fuscus]KAB7647393.1 winged helix-turn-helix transcriptional regulator [Polymorphobacter fuscus]MQT16635.1 MarR family transcriptional regulator [Polymorphobacter fuscus]NJC09382.1 DNA-binding MarR family transcriptional regulator [Polymorphobacter fuscus]